MEYELRTYKVKPGEMAGWLDEWSRYVVPLRRRHGFEIVGAWQVEGADMFVWILGHDGDYAAADAAYYASPERAALDPDPARFLESTETRMLRAVAP